MFQSKAVPIVIPQYEHGRLAGELAALWGNDEFDRPPMDFDAFVAGVAFHDWAYGRLDNLPLGEMAEEAWLPVAERSVAQRFAHPVTDIVAKLHFRRLLSKETSAERQALIAAMDEKIATRLAETDHERADFAWADHITRFCDTCSFHFCFGRPRAVTLAVPPRVGSTGTVEVTLRIEEGGRIGAEPWPFAVDGHEGLVVGYQAKGYPERLQPVMVGYRLERG